MEKNYYHERWDFYTGRKVKINTLCERYDDIKENETGVWQYYVENEMCAILLDGEEKPRLFHIFDYKFI